MNGRRVDPSSKSDIYQLGLCMLIMCNVEDMQCILSHVKEQPELHEFFIKQKIRNLDTNTQDSGDLTKRLLNQMLEMDRTKRLTSEEVYEKAQHIYSHLVNKTDLPSPQQRNNQAILINDKNVTDETVEFCDYLNVFLEIQKKETIHRLKKIISSKNVNKSDCISHTMNSIHSLLENTQLFTTNMLLN